MNDTGPEQQRHPAPMPAAGGRRKFLHTVLLCFLAIALLPLATDSLLNYLNTHKLLHQETAARLAATAQHKTHDIETFFADTMRLLTQEANQETVHEQLAALKRAHDASGRTTADFLATPAWHALARKTTAQFRFFRQSNDLYDLFLIDEQGNILFTMAGEKDLGTNILTGPYAGTHFGHACRDALANGRPAFSDFLNYAPSHGATACFLAVPIRGQDGTPLGLLAAQLSFAKIDRLMQTEERGGHIQSFLIGQDLLLRTHSGQGKNGGTLLATLVDTPPARDWRDRFVIGNATRPRPVAGETYINQQGREVLGLYNNLKVGGTPLAVITEIPAAEAFRAVNDQARSAILLFLAVAAVVLVLALWAASWVTRPLVLLTRQAGRIAVGDLAIPAAPQLNGDNEFALLAKNFHNIAATLREITAVCGDIALGIFDRRVAVRSDQDLLAQSVNQMVDSFQVVVEQANRISQGDFSMAVPPRSAHDTLGLALGRMATNLAEQDWIRSGVAELNNRMRGDLTITELSSAVLTFLAGYLDAPVGALFVADDDGRLQRTAGYAYTPPRPEDGGFAPGEGLVGQAALDKKPLLLRQVPADHVNLTIDSGLGASPADTILVFPFSWADEVMGVVEFGTNRDFTELEIGFLKRVGEAIAINIHTAQSRRRVQLLLEETQLQSAELQSQQEELKVSNEELEEQGEELRAANEELEEKTERLEHQRLELQRAKEEIEAKARELTRASRYKSEFLANMSHELRSPLNSLLILAKSLADNEEGNLTEAQREAARIIHNGGHDLLNLINDILDLSKVEAGRLEIRTAPFQLGGLCSDLEDRYGFQARNKGLAFGVTIAPELSPALVTDQQRLAQILNNLINNAIKFTDTGTVSLTVAPALADTPFHHPDLRKGEVVAFAVRDTGIGIPTDKQEAIFEAFRQGDGSTSRRYGGTGLGLTISRQLARLLGGELHLASHPGEGSTFTFYLPARPRPAADAMGTPVFDDLAPAAPAVPSTEPPPAPAACPLPAFIDDDRAATRPGDRSLLVIEDDAAFARILVDMARGKGYRALAAGDGRSGLLTARDYRPRAIILDLGLPDLDGMAVLEDLKNDPATRHIPVHIVSARDNSVPPLRKGAVGHLAKPATREGLDRVFAQFEKLLDGDVRRLLLVDGDPASLASLERLLARQAATISTATTGEAALKKFAAEHFDCLILDMGLPDMSSFDLLALMAGPGGTVPVPVIVYTGRELTEEESESLSRYASTVVVKGEESGERLLDEVSLFLHSMTASLPPEQQEVIRMIHDNEEVLRDRTILLVDDDMRNTFALSGLLQRFGMRVEMAANGKQALEKLEETAVDLVLMDIMMPVMDGYETTRRIKARPRFRDLPVIALTAKAMADDRQLCLAAGADDYLAKPVDQERLLSLLRVWLFK